MEGAGAATVTGVQSNRVNGLNTNLASEAVTVDVHGNRTVTRSSVNAAAKTVTRTVDHWDSTNDAVSVTVNGLLLTNVTKTALTYTYAYDGLERRTGVTDPRIGTSTTHYNGKGQVDWVEDAATNRTTYAYDPDTGRRIAVTNAQGNATRYEYSPDGQLIATWGAAYPVAYDYDEYHRMSAMYTSRGTNQITSYSEILDLKSAMDVTRWLYDEPTGLLTNKVYDDGNGVTYTYTANGRLKSRTWARGITTDYRYDALGQLTNIDYSASATNVSFTYDRIGRQSTVEDGLGTRSFTYNDALQLAVETNALGVITRSYDANTGRNAGFALDGTLDVGYAYDAMGRFNTVTWTNAAAGGPEQEAQYAYCANSDLLREFSINDGDLTQTRVYEPDRNLIAAISNAAGSTIVSLYEYGNDGLGRRTNRVDQLGGAGSTPSVTNVFGYNTRSELTSADMGTNDYSYVYDNIGNRTAYTNNSEAWEYLANSLNQYTNIADGTTNDLLYDLDGNLTNDGVRAYSWNGENRLIGVEPLSPAAGDKKVVFAYDYMGRRIKKVVSTYDGGWSVAQTNRFCYDGWNLIRETVRNPQSEITNSFVWGLDLSGTLQGAGGIGGLIAWSRSDTTTNFLYCYDANGNVGQLVDAADTTNIVASYGPGPFGNMAAMTGTESRRNPFRFSSKYADDETELVYYGYRYYSPGMGRWVNRDPLGERGAVPLYVALVNSPLNENDYLGLISREDAQGFCLAAERLWKNSQKVRPGWQYGGFWNFFIDHLRCEVDFDCEECCEEEQLTRGEASWNGQTRTCNIRICANRFEVKDPWYWPMAIINHELTHCYQGCGGFWVWDCESCICNEIQAGYVTLGGRIQGNELIKHARTACINEERADLCTDEDEFDDVLDRHKDDRGSIDAWVRRCSRWGIYPKLRPQYRTQ